MKTQLEPTTTICFFFFVVVVFETPICMANDRSPLDLLPLCFYLVHCLLLFSVASHSIAISISRRPMTMAIIHGIRVSGGKKTSLTLEKLP